MLGLVTEIIGQCWVGTYGRGVGRPLHRCRNNLEKNGLLCYPICNNNFYGVGPVCWSRCDHGYEDHGALCTRPPHIYWKCCCVNFGFWNNGCCGICPHGYNDDGCTCHRWMHTYAKSTYGRGVGEPMICSDNEDQNVGLCYPKCRNGYNGIGPVCWMHNCPHSMPYRCGLLCTIDKKQCDEFIKSLVGDSFQLILNIAETGGMNPSRILGVASSVTSIASTLINDVCEGNMKLPSFCIKKMSLNNGVFHVAGCTGDNSFNCGLFCTSSEVKCAKEKTRLVSFFTGVLSDVSGLSLPDFKNMKTNTIEFLKEIKSKYPNIIEILIKGGKVFDSVKEIHDFVDGIRSITESIIDYGEHAATGIN